MNTQTNNCDSVPSEGCFNRAGRIGGEEGEGNTQLIDCSMEGNTDFPCANLADGNSEYPDNEVYPR